MSTVAEKSQMVDRIFEEMGQRIPVVHITPAYAEQVMTDPRREHLWGWTPEGKLMLVVVDERGGRHVFTLPLIEGQPVQTPAGQMVSFGARKLGEGVWTVEPSLLVPGMLHAYVTLCDVPAAPPWAEKKVVAPA